MILSVGKKSKLNVLFRILVNVLWIVSLAIILASCSRGDDDSKSTENGSNGGLTYTIEGGATITSHCIITKKGPISIAADPTGKFTYAANNNSNNVSGYTIDATTGVLTEITGSPFEAGSNPSCIALDPSGKFVYVTNSGSDNVSAYTIDANTGALTELDESPFSLGSQPESITVDPTGNFAYIVMSDNNISTYEIDAISGSLIEVAGSPTVTSTTP
jgi:YVTN family beta-propeller protein